MESSAPSRTSYNLKRSNEISGGGVETYGIGPGS
jgi:hypothetical protein